MLTICAFILSFSLFYLTKLITISNYFPSVLLTSRMAKETYVFFIYKLSLGRRKKKRRFAGREAVVIKMLENRLPDHNSERLLHKIQDTAMNGWKVHFELTWIFYKDVFPYAYWKKKKKKSEHTILIQKQIHKYTVIRFWLLFWGVC